MQPDASTTPEKIDQSGGVLCGIFSRIRLRIQSAEPGAWRFVWAGPHRDNINQALGGMDNSEAETLEAFVSAEGDPGLYDLLVGLIDKHRLGQGPALQTIHLNVFDLEIDHSAGMVSIQDIIGLCADAVVPLADFMARLKTGHRV